MAAEKKNPGQVSAYLDADVYAQVLAFAKKEDRSVSWVVGHCVKQFMAMQDGPMDADELRDLSMGRQLDFVGGATGNKKHVSSLAGAVAAAVKRGPAKKASKHK